MHYVGTTKMDMMIGRFIILKRCKCNSNKDACDLRKARSFSTEQEARMWAKMNPCCEDPQYTIAKLVYMGIEQAQNEIIQDFSKTAPFF